MELLRLIAEHVFELPVAFAKEFGWLAALGALAFCFLCIFFLGWLFFKLFEWSGLLPVIVQIVTVAVILFLFAVGFRFIPKFTATASAFLFVSWLIVGALKEHGMLGYVVGATGPVKEYVSFWGKVPYTTALATLAVITAVPLGMRYYRENRRINVRFYDGRQGSISIKQFDPKVMRMLE